MVPEELEGRDVSMSRRLLVKPGITGLWQVSGRSEVSWDERCRLDLHYVDNWSVTRIPPSFRLPADNRLLFGGRSVTGLAAAATTLAYLVGLAIGLVAGYSRSIADPILMRTVDVMLAFPPLLFLLVLIAGAGSSVGILILGVAIIQAPAVSRIVRTATLEVSVRGYVEAAVARGERPIAVVVREVLPNILAPVLVDAGLRFTFSILIIASVNFLGLGLQPPSSDWARMIGENRAYISLNSLSVVGPAAMIALLTIGINLTGDAIARSLGRSYTPRTTRSIVT